MVARRGHHQTCSAHQRPEELPDRHVEAERGLLQHRVADAQAVGLLHPAQAVAQRRMAVAGALGLAGGTGGVDDIGKILAVQLDPWIVLGMVFQPGIGLVQVDPLHTLRQRQLQVRLAEQQLHAAVLQHVGLALLGILRVHRHVGAAGLEDRHQGHDHLDGALHGHAHQAVRTDPALDQGMRQAVGPAVQLGVVQALLAEGQRRRRRRALDLLLEQPVHAALQRVLGSSGVPAFQQLVALGGSQAVQLAQRRPRVFAHPQQQAFEAFRQALDRRLVESLAGIAVVQFEGLSGAHQQRQRIVRLLLVAKRVDPHVRRCLFRQRCGNRVVLEYQDVVEQGLADLPGPTLDVIQRRVLELAQRQVFTLHRLQPVANRLLRTRAGDHRQRVDEQADLLLDPAQLRRTTGYGGTEGHGVLPGEALQQYQPGRLDQGIERHLLLTGELCQALARGDVQLPIAIGMALGTPHPVGERRNQQGRLAQPLKALLPERLGATRILALQPGDVVAIAPIRARRRLAAVALQDFAEQLRVAPAVHQNVVIGVDQVVPAFAGTHQHQPQQRRLGEFEAEPGLAGGEGIERLGEVRAVAPVVHAERHLDALAHQLQRFFQRALPEEPAAQDFVGIQRRLPGLAEALGIQAFHVQTHLVDVVAAVLLVQAVEQHTLLHRRQRIEILHLARRQGQSVQLPLVEPGQGEVRRGHAFDIGGATMLDQRQQLVAIGIGQAKDARLAETRGAEAPVDTEPAGIDLAVETQPVVQRRVAVALAAGRIGAGTEQRGGIGGEAAVELSQVVEGDARTRQGRQRRPILGAAEVTQGAETQPLVRNRAQLLLDPFDRSAQLRHRRQAQREQAGEPAYRAGQVDVLEQLLAPVSFELDEGIRLAGPATDDPRQGGEQQIVDLGPVGRRRFLQQPARGLFGQLGTCRTDMPDRLRTLAIIAGQFGGYTFELRQPVAALALQAAVAGMRLQAFGPRLEGAGLGG